MIPGLREALAGRFKFVEEVSQMEIASATGKGLSDGIKAAGGGGGGGRPVPTVGTP